MRSEHEKMFISSKKIEVTLSANNSVGVWGSRSVGKARSQRCLLPCAWDYVVLYQYQHARPLLLLTTRLKQRLDLSRGASLKLWKKLRISQNYWAFGLCRNKLCSVFSEHFSEKVTFLTFILALCLYLKKSEAFLVYWFSFRPCL